MSVTYTQTKEQITKDNLVSTLDITLVLWMFDVLMSAQSALLCEELGKQ